MQGKLFGQVKKTGIGRFDGSGKRKATGGGVERESSETKKARISEGVGLGIGNGEFRVHKNRRMRTGLELVG
jgi:hypothetical protein